MSRYHLDAYAAVDRGRAQLSSFLRSSFRFQDQGLDKSVHKMIDDFGLLAPPVVEATFPYAEPEEGPRSLGDLAAAGMLDAELVSLMEAAKGDARWRQTRPLYKHQIEAIRAYLDRRSLVVASGTGSGKTECFLLPAIDRVLRDKDLSQPGVRVLIVYPLNALVNNQMDRLRAILGHHPKIRFALYTRRLAETEKRAERRLRSGEYRYPAELVSRQALRESPPHILVTNFSMLEYALVRPADAPLFSDGFAKPSLVVLDEAHVYAGSMAAEITMLLRRAWLRWNLKPHSVQGIVTSATMHQGIAGGADLLRKFAGDVLSKPSADVIAIEGRRVMPPDQDLAVDAPLPSPTEIASLQTDFPTLADERDEDGSLRHVFDATESSRAAALSVVRCLRPGFGPPTHEACASALLWQALAPLGWVRRLRARLHDERLRVDQIASDLFGSDGGEATRRQAVHRILEVLSLARSSSEGLPLLPVRLHAILRGPHGVFACIDGSCPEASVPGRLGALYPDPIDRCSCGAIVCELRVCEGCGQSFLMAEEVTDEELGVPRLQHIGPRTVTLLVAKETWDDGTELVAPRALCVLPDGRIVEGGSIRFSAFPGGRVSAASRQLATVPCPHCDLARPGIAVIRKIEAGTNAALQVTLDGIYPALPEHANADSEHLPGRGRRALLFADNRQVAASLAAKVEESHDLVLSRAILLGGLTEAMKSAVQPGVDQLTRELHDAMKRKDAKATTRVMAAMEDEMAAAGEQSASFPSLVHAIATHESLRQISSWSADATDELAKLLVVRELARRPARVGNLEASGLIVLDYSLALSRPSDSDVARAFEGDTWRALVEVLLDMLRTSGMVSLPPLGDRYSDYVVHERYGKLLVRAARTFEDADNEDVPVSGDRLALLAAPGRTTRRAEYLDRVLRTLGAPARLQPSLVLEHVWTALTAAAKVDGSCLRGDAAGDSVTLPLTLMRFREGKGTRRWRCQRCATVWCRQVALVCPTRHCNGILTALQPDEFDLRDRLVQLAMAHEPLLGMHTEEHTAQIGVLALADTEKAFKEGRTNILVSSTTMELGIDIGGLSATVLTNVPPGASNYLQRAGRAGRRAEGTSLVLTFARPRPFDQAVFEQPEKPFRDKIIPPSVKLDSRRIVQRHANAFLLATFFRRYRAESDAADPMASLRTVGEFFDRPIANVLVETGWKPFDSLGVDIAHDTLADAFVTWLGCLTLTDAALQVDLRALLFGTALDSAEPTAVGERATEQMGSIIMNVRDQLAYLRNERRDEEGKPASDQDSGMLQAIEYQEQDLLRDKLLGYLAEEQFLPRYGFPVQVVPLCHRWKQDRDARGKIVYGDEDTELRLQRDIALALNEYAPGAEVIANKHIFASRGVVRHWTGTDAPGVLASRFLAVCPACSQLQYARTKGEVQSPCPTCKTSAPRTISVVFPKHGFAVKWGARPRRWTSGARAPMRPVTEASYAARRGETVVQVSTALWLGYDEEGQIVVRCEGDLAEADLSVGAQPASGTPREGYGYAICYLCGRTEPEEDRSPDDLSQTGGADPLPKQLANHGRLRGHKACAAKHEYWRHMALVGGVRTETLRFQLRGVAEPPPGPAGRRLAMTWLVALQLSAGETLGIDSRSIGGLLEPREGTAGVVYDAILYDQVAGGAGHCRTLLERWTDLLDAVRARLECPNMKCTNGCHRCLIAFETQRYGDLLRRSALKAFLEDKWDALKQNAVRDGHPVMPLFRGGGQLREALARTPSARVIVCVESIADGALGDDGWLRMLLRHADAGGQVSLVVERVPNPDDDAERFLAERLRLAVTEGRFELRRAGIGAVSGFQWRVVVPEASGAYFIDGELARHGLAPEWLSSGILEATGETSVASIRAQADQVVAKAALVGALALQAKPPPPSVVIRYVPPNEPALRATFEHWLRGPSGESLFERALTELTIIDPFLATDWQLRLLGEIVAAAKKAGCATLKIETYPPDRNKEGSGYGLHRTVTQTEQHERIAEMIGSATWRPMPDLGKHLRKHKRLLQGRRSDGTRFDVILERGIDFITDRRVGRDFERTTRETYVIVRDPL